MSKFKVGDVVFDIDSLVELGLGKIIYILDKDFTGFGKFLVEYPSVMIAGYKRFWHAEDGARIWKDNLPDKVIAFLKSRPKETGYLWRDQSSIDLYAGEIIEEEDCGGLKYL